MGESKQGLVLLYELIPQRVYCGRACNHVVEILPVFSSDFSRNEADLLNVRNILVYADTLCVVELEMRSLGSVNETKSVDYGSEN